jgi:hypothetical protein
MREFIKSRIHKTVIHSHYDANGWHRSSRADLSWRTGHARVLAGLMICRSLRDYQMLAIKRILSSARAMSLVSTERRRMHALHGLR